MHMGPEGNPYWAMVGRDQVSIMLKAISPEVNPVPNPSRHPWASWDAYIFTMDPDILFEEYRLKGVSFIKPIHDNSDELRGFELKDWDGYVLFFGCPKNPK